MRATGIAACAALSLFTQLAYAGGCDPIIAAQIKALTVPTRSHTTLEMNGVLMMAIDSISVDGKVYTRANGGAWKEEAPAPLTEDKIKKIWSGGSCSLLGSESVAGETADVYSGDFGHDMVGRHWIARSSGMVLKASTTLPNGVSTSTFDYADVHAPGTATQ
jgi:hypothetical protein